MAKQRVSFISDAELKAAEFRWRIETGQFTAADFASLTAEEQDTVRQILFQMYAGRVSVPQALSGLEFSVMPAAKLLVKVIRGEPLTEQELAFADRFGAIIGEHPMPLDPETWELPYLEQQIQAVVANREAYREKKQEIMGEF